MPDAVKKDFGGALHAVQEGTPPDEAKPLKGKGEGSGAALRGS
jgi:phage-related protein